MTGPKRIQRKRTKGWRMPEGAVYVGRPSRWGNHYTVDRLSAYEAVVLDRDGNEIPDSWGSPHFAAKWAVDRFRTDLLWDFSTFADMRKDYLWQLRGRDLACWCPLDSPCHGDVLLEIANTNRPDAVGAGESLAASGSQTGERA